MSSSKRKARELEDPTLSNDEAIEVLRSVRDEHPAHYMLKIESYSVLSELKIEKYESDEFEASGYKWKLCFYPNGDWKRNGSNHVSLYLVISDTNNLPKDWEVNVQFKLFVYNNISDKYLTVQVGHGRTSGFHWAKKEWGFARLLPLDFFKDSVNGYLINDTCVFGAEVLVVKNACTRHTLSMKKERLSNTFTWKIEHFSAIKEEMLLSEVFKVGDRQWKLLMYPKGVREFKGKSLSLFVVLADYAILHSRVYAESKIVIKSQTGGNNFEMQRAINWYGKISRGMSDFLTLSNLNDKLKGFIVNDTIIVEAEITMCGIAKNCG